MKQISSFNLLLITFLECFVMVKNESDFESKIKIHPGLKALPKDCGLYGYLKTERQWLGIVTDSHGNFQCSGALISYQHFLFPAACLQSDDFKIYLSNDECWMEGKDECQPEETFDSHDVDVIFHPESREPPENNRIIDIAIIHLKTSINQQRVPVCLPVHKNWYEHNLKIAGANGYEIYDDTFQYTRDVVQVKTARQCSNKFKDVFSQNTNFCTNTTDLEYGATVSRGLMMRKESRVILFGMLLSHEKHPEATLFTRVQLFLHWILDVLATPQTSNSFLSHPNYILFSKPCGRANIGNRVSFGKNTEIFQYQWSALLKYNRNGNFSFRCGGSLIASRYVLSAAHCITKLHSDEKLIGVRLGEYDLSTEIDCSDEDDPSSCAPPVQDISIEKYSIPPGYDGKKIGPNDIALIKLTEDFQENMILMPICLPFSEKLQDLNHDSLTIVGWGQTEKDLQGSNILQEASLTVVSINECRDFYTSKSVTLSEKQFCAGHRQIGVSSCKGDSGSPLFTLVNFNNHSRYVQYGIVSAGLVDCGKTASYGINTKVTSFLGWILDTVEQ